jgi:hypothetical protein
LKHENNVKKCERYAAATLISSDLPFNLNPHWGGYIWITLS